LTKGGLFPANVLNRGNITLYNLYFGCSSYARTQLESREYCVNNAQIRTMKLKL